ncbi:MAG: cytidylate kinase, partial [Candidatus Nanohaloarchaea archaeon]
ALEEEVRKRDSENDRRYEEYYGIDTSDLEIYDLVIDNTELSIKEQNEFVDRVLEQRFPERFDS